MERKPMKPQQAIETRFLGPTDAKRARVVALSASGRRATVDWDGDLDATTNHARAAEALARRLEWLQPGEEFADRYACGGTRSGYVFVRVAR